MAAIETQVVAWRTSAHTADLFLAALDEAFPVPGTVTP